MTARVADSAPAGRASGSLARQLSWIIGIRLVVITSVVLPYFLLQIAAPGEGLGLDFLYGLGGLTYAASLVYIALLHFLKGRWAIQAFIQFCGDLLFITGLVYYFGGITSPFSILYFIVIIVASAVFSRRTGFAVAALASLLYGATTFGLAFGWIPAAQLRASDEVGLETAGSPALTPTLAYYLITHVFGFFTVAYLTTRLAQSISRAERELKEKKEDLADLQIVHRDVIESIPSGLITCDLEGLVTSANLAGLEILGREVTDLMGRPVTELGLFSADEWQELISQAHESPRARPETLYGRQGLVRHIGYSVTPLTNAEEMRTGYILIFQDLSDWRQLQEELRLKDRLAAVGELASGIAHELGNPLAAISGSVQMLSATPTAEPGSNRLLDIIRNESRRLDRTIKSFLQFARPKEPSRIRFDIAQLLEEHFHLLRNSDEVSDAHTLEMDLDPPSLGLTADPDQISQIFWNLARNALRAMPEGGTLRIEGRLQANHYSIRVTDSGCGMSEEERDRMFQPFHSFFDGGLGIGMAIVYRIVEEHGGRLDVQSSPDRGTTITVELPTTPSVEPAAFIEA